MNPVAGEDDATKGSADAELRRQHEADEPADDASSPDEQPGGGEDRYGVLMLCARHAREKGVHAHVEVESEWCDACNAGDSS